ncbi:unnamed protein product [Mesocestoides corti]|uniref:Uncharacterized protein n=1 Tax=Mesocestoides corti TaxID=53468 RepID=A0A158QW87_MESCO|nr:unnamed protein product [Mesocestoides corti]
MSLAPNLNCPGLSYGGPCTPGLTIFVHLLCISTNESVHRATLGVLVEVAQDRDSLDAVASVPGISIRLNELANSRNEAISTYAGTLILRLTATPDDSSASGGGHKAETLNTPPPLPMDTSGGRMSPVVASSCFPPQTVFHQHHNQSAPYAPQQSQQRYSQGNYHYAGEASGGSLMAMVGPPPPPATSVYVGGGGGCPISTQTLPPQQHQHCFQQQVNESVYPQCSWSGSPYSSEPQGRPVYTNTMPPHHPLPPHQEVVYGSAAAGYPPLAGARGGGATYHHRGSPASTNYYSSGYVEQQHPVGPIASPNPRACYPASTPTSMDTTAAAGYPSAGTAAGRLPPADAYMGGALQSANSSTPTSSAASDHRWFSSAQMCLP